MNTIFPALGLCHKANSSTVPESNITSPTPLPAGAAFLISPTINTVFLHSLVQEKVAILQSGNTVISSHYGEFSEAMQRHAGNSLP